MPTSPTPKYILETLLPQLRIAATYARQLQPKIATLPAKETGDNFFAAALTDADLAIQNLVEVVLLANFPEIRFYGEEYELSGNTKYFRSIELGDRDDYLVTLDPIDGTRFYLDGHSNYQIIVSILNNDDYEAVLAISPAQDRYFYALRGEGAFSGKLDRDLDACDRLTIESNKQSAVLLGWGLSSLKSPLTEQYRVIDVATDYSRDRQIPNLNGIFSGDISGAILKSGKFIDGAALTFLAREAGCIATDLEGLSLPSLHSCSNYGFSGIVVATNNSIHQDLLTAIGTILPE
jgi:myo-inositol-1(or 4)-monophosphatase